MCQTISARQGPCPGQVFSYSNRTNNHILVLAIPGSFMEFPDSLQPLLYSLDTSLKRESHVNFMSCIHPTEVLFKLDSWISDQTLLYKLRSKIVCLYQYAPDICLKLPGKWHICDAMDQSIRKLYFQLQKTGLFFSLHHLFQIHQIYLNKVHVFCS